MKEYLKEAFRAMEILEEENFKLNDSGINDLLYFKDNDEVNDIVNVFDPDVDEEEDVRDTYIGCAILECTVCHSPIFKDIEDVKIDEESDLANVEDECPICHSQDGYKIIGQVSPYQEDPEVKVDVEYKSECNCDDDGCVCVDSENSDDSINSYDEDDDIDESLIIEKYIDESDVTYRMTNSKGDSVSASSMAEVKQLGKKQNSINSSKPFDDKDDVTIEQVRKDGDKETIVKTYDSDGKSSPKANVDENLDEECCEEECNKKKVREGFEKIDLEMEDKIIHVSEEEKEPIPDAEMITPVSDELEAELLAPEEEEEIPEEAPAEDVTMGDMNVDETIPEEDVEEPIDDLDGDVPEDEEISEYENDDYQESLKSIAGNKVNEGCENGTMIDIPVEHFSEVEFDKLGESYLKNVYDNVNTFRTSKVSQKDDSLVVEGVIKFNSGKEKLTTFIFEAKDANKSGKVRFVGENAQISRGKKSFTLAGSVNNGKFIAESLNYNYRVNSNRIYGTVKING